MRKATDYEICAEALREARKILSEYINPLNPADPVNVLDRIIDALDNEPLEASLKRIDGRNHFSVVWTDSLGSPEGD